MLPSIIVGILLLLTLAWSFASIVAVSTRRLGSARARR